MQQQDVNFKYPETDKIEPEQAKFLYEQHCANLIVEGLPLGSEFGIDIVSYQIGEKFKGVKMIPPGIHFVFASPLDKRTSQLGPRTGFFHNFKCRELLIKEWSEVDEDFVETTSESDLLVKRERYLANMRDLDKFLGAYRYSYYETYKRLTSKLSSDHVHRLMPICAKIRSVPYLVKQEKNDDESQIPKKPQRATLWSSDEIKPNESNLLPELKQEPKSVINFTSINKNANEPHLITVYNLDTSARLEQCFEGSCGKQQLLAEFEFAFVVFLLCHVYECFEHWKELLKLICLADGSLSKCTQFFIDFVNILCAQFEQVSQDLFEDIIDDNNFVLGNLSIFFQNIDYLLQQHDKQNNNNLQHLKTLKKTAQKLRKYLIDKFNWNFDVERDDEQPTIVD